jgi:hypothetical protein
VSERHDDPIFEGEPPSPGPGFELDENAERALGEALRSAWDPSPIDPARHRELLELALLDPFAPPTADEVRESERLRQALETGDESHEDVALLRALSRATKPEPPSAEASRRAEGELEKEDRPRSNVVFASFGAVALAAAAVFALFLGTTTGQKPAAERLVPSRSTAELFEGSFERGGATERIDRIATARAHDLRENRYTLWGAR